MKPERISPVTNDRRFQIRIPVLRLGPVAVRVLAKGGRGRVIAVFERSFYCEIDHAQLCIGSAALGMGPINIMVPEMPGNLPEALALRIGTPVVVSDDRIRIGDGLLLSLAGVSIWAPPVVPVWSPASARSGLEYLLAVAAQRLPRDGLGRFLGPEMVGDRADSPVLRHAAVPLKSLMAWLREALLDPAGAREPVPASWQDLIGLGPGLTPSGDDLIGGIMLALDCLGENSVLEVLASALTRAMRELTHPISAAYLAAAMEGIGCESAHMTINAILAGDHGKCVEAIEAVEKFGHTSGWDMLAGMAIAVRLWLECVEERQSVA